MGYRKFSLVNGNNTVWELTNPEFKSFAANPTGLGFSADTSYMRVGNDNIITYSQWEMVEKNFDIMFYSDTQAREYQMYADFVRFLTYEPIYLIYETPNSGNAYRMKVKVSALGKTEISPSTSALTCPISMTPLSFWEDNLVNEIVVDASLTNDGKEYPLIRPYYYAEAGVNNVSISCDGTIDTPMLITITGTMENPQYSLFDENGDMYGTGKFSGTYSSLLVNSDEAEETIELAANGTPVSNPYNYQDLTVGSPDTVQVTFLKLKASSTSKMSFALSQSFSGLVSIQWRNRYLSV